MTMDETKLSYPMVAEPPPPSLRAGEAWAAYVEMVRAENRLTLRTHQLLKQLALMEAEDSDWYFTATTRVDDFLLAQVEGG